MRDAVSSGVSLLVRDQRCSVPSAQYCKALRCTLQRRAHGCPSGTKRNSPPLCVSFQGIPKPSSARFCSLKKRFAPTLAQALTCLDDSLLPSTSNALERGNRRYRKRPKQVYRVRTYRSGLAWHGICGVKPNPQAVNKPSPHSIMHGLDKPGVFTTPVLPIHAAFRRRKSFLWQLFGFFR